MNINLTLIGQTVSMAVFVWLCMKYVWPPIINALEERKKTIADGLAAAQRGENALDEARVEAEGIVSEARDTAGQIREQANQQATSIRDQAKQDAVAERERQLAAAKAEIAQETNRAKEALRAQVAALAVAGAEKLIEREIDASAHKDILDKLVAEL